MPEREPRREANWLTDAERLDERISHTRLLGVLQRRDVVIHSVKDDHNAYGEFLFVTVSRQTAHPRVITFYGLGYHEHRERWLVDIWRFYDSRMLHPPGQAVMPKAEALRIIAEHEAEVRRQAQPEQRSGQAELYELLADLGDDDSALADMEDLDWPTLDGEP
jgi:hypothetical protein